MLVKTISYQDLDGNRITEDFYFNLNKAEIAEMQLSHGNGMDRYLTDIIKSGNNAMILAAFKEILSRSYGKRSENGKGIIKSDKITNEFLGSDAYSELFMELISDANFASEFVNGIMPADMIAEAKKSNRMEKFGEKTADEYSDNELLAMDESTFNKVVGDLKNAHKRYLLLALKRKNSAVA